MDWDVAYAGSGKLPGKYNVVNLVGDWLLSFAFFDWLGKAWSECQSLEPRSHCTVLGLSFNFTIVEFYNCSDEKFSDLQEDCCNLHTGDS